MCGFFRTRLDMMGQEGEPAPRSALGAPTTAWAQEVEQRIRAGRP